MQNGNWLAVMVPYLNQRATDLLASLFWDAEALHYIRSYLRTQNTESIYYYKIFSNNPCMFLSIFKRECYFDLA